MRRLELFAPYSLMAKVEGALTEYQSFLAKASVLFLMPFLPLDKRLFFPTAMVATGVWCRGAGLSWSSSLISRVCNWRRKIVKVRLGKPVKPLTRELCRPTWVLCAEELPLTCAFASPANTHFSPIRGKRVEWRQLRLMDIVSSGFPGALFTGT